MDSTTIVAVAGLVTTAFVAVFGVWGQRAIAREERLWERRANAYEDLTGYVLREDLRASLTLPVVRTGNEEDLKPPPLTDEQWWALHGRLAAFGSHEVRTAVDDFLGLRQRFGVAAAYLQDVVDRRPSNTADRPDWIEEHRAIRPQVEELREKFKTQAELIVDLVGTELRSRPTGRRWPWHRTPS